MIQSISLYVMAAIYVFAGLNHFINPRFYISIMPKFFPMPNLLNQISGIAEIILGIGLLFTASRQLSAYLIIAMLVVFFAVHIPHLITPPKMANGKYWVLILRIPIQFLLIYWAYIVSKY
jgi:uncharacterized membrane protein